MGEKSADSPSQDQLHIDGLDQDQEQGDMCNEADGLEDCSDEPGDPHYQRKDETEVRESSKKRKQSDMSRDPAPLKRLGLNRKEIPTRTVSIRHSHPYSLHPRSEDLFNFEDEPIVKASAYADSSAADGLTYRPIGSGEMREQSEILKASCYADSSLAEGFLTYRSTGSGKMPGQSEAKANNGPPNGPKPPKNKIRKASCYADSSPAEGFLNYPSSGSSKMPGQSEAKANNAPPKVQKQSKNKTSSDRSAQKSKNTKSKGFFCFPFGGN